MKPVANIDFRTGLKLESFELETICSLLEMLVDRVGLTFNDWSDVNVGIKEIPRPLPEHLKGKVPTITEDELETLLNKMELEHKRSL